MPFSAECQDSVRDTERRDCWKRKSIRTFGSVVLDFNLIVVGAVDMWVVGGVVGGRGEGGGGRLRQQQSWFLR